MNDDVDPKTQESWLSKAIAWIRSASTWLLWPAIGIAFALIFTLFVVRPFAKGTSSADEDVATAWITSIGRLGILPVYPPSEDIHVGDLWGVVADAEDALLLNKAVRLTQIDLRNEVIGDARGPVFGDTTELAQGKGFRVQDPKEVSPTTNQISLSLTAFPGVVIKHNIKASGASGFGFGAFTGERDGDQTEEIRIPHRRDLWRTRGRRIREVDRVLQRQADESLLYR